MQRSAGGEWRPWNFAFVAVFLVALVIGMIETSRSFMAKEALSNAARTGCRLACSASGTDAAVTTEIRTILKDNLQLTDDEVKSATITIQVTGTGTNLATAQRGDRVSVTVTMPVNKISLASGLFVSNMPSFRRPWS